MQQSFQKARQLYLSGLLFDSLTECESILAQAPDHADTLNLVGMLCYRGGDSKSALDYFKQAVASAPNHAEALGNLALCYKGAGLLAEAFETYELALGLDPDDAQVHYNYGLALKLGGRLEQSALHFSKAAELAPLMGDVFNMLGLVRSEQGQSELAVLAFRNALAAHPESRDPYLNLAVSLTKIGMEAEAVKVLTLGSTVHGLPVMGRQLADAHAATGNISAAASTLSAYVMTKPDDADALETLGDLRFQLGWFDQALDAFAQAVAADESRARAHMKIFSIAQILERPQLALIHQAKALASTRLFTEIGKNPDAPVLLVLKAPGDWQINTPTDFILRPQDWSAIHYYFLDENRPFSPDIPDCDAIFNAIAEPDRAAKALKGAATIVALLGKPCINPPQSMLAANRETASRLLSKLPNSIIPQVKRVQSVETLADFPSPYLLRPAGTHAGNGMQLIKDKSQRPAAIDGEHYALPFIDYISADGQYRKYRVVVVAGRPMPFHMGLSIEWMVHYANAKPKDRAQMDREEEVFLSDIKRVFPAPLLDDLSQMAEILDLDFFAVDCAIHQDGRLVLFEVDAGAIIHTLDNPTLYPYKHAFVPRIYDALKDAILAKIQS